jgi:hypothetical protein
MLGMRHQAHHVAGGVADAGDVARRAVEVVAGRVAQHDLVRGQIVGRPVAPAHVLGRDRQGLADRARARPRDRRVDDLDVDLAADEPQARVRQQRARQQSGFAQDLEPVADPQHEAAVAGELLDLGHHGREAGDRTGAQVVAVREPAGDDHGVDALEVVVGVPQQLGVPDPLRSEQRVALVARAGELDDAVLHEGLPPQVIQTCGLTGSIGIRPLD